MIGAGIVHQDNFKILEVLLKYHLQAMAYPAFLVLCPDDYRYFGH
jgi:hypothetical protein